MQSTSFRLISLAVTILLLAGLALVVRLALLSNPTTLQSPTPLHSIAQHSTQRQIASPPSTRATTPQPSPQQSAAGSTPQPTAVTGTPVKSALATDKITPGAAEPTSGEKSGADENSQRVEAGGFSFQPLTNYTLEWQNGAVNMLGKPGATVGGDAFLLSGGPPAQFTSKATGSIAEIFNEYVNFYAQKDNFRIGIRQPITVDQTRGFMVDLTSADTTKHFAGRIVMVEPRPEQIFVMVGVAPAQQWQTATINRFETMLASVKFFALPPVLASAPQPTLASVTPTATQRPASTPARTATTTQHLLTPTAQPHQTAVAPKSPNRVAQWQTYSNANMINALAVYNNKIWAATQGGVVAWNTENSSLVKFTTLEGLAANDATSVVACPLPGLGIVFGTMQGLQIFDLKSGNWKLLNNSNSSMSFNDVAVLNCSVENSFLLIGYQQHGFDIFDARTGIWQYTNQKNGLQNDFVDAVAVVGNREAIWVSSGFGISRLPRQGDPTFFTNNNSALETNQITAMTADKSGTIWLGASDAVYKVSADNWTVYNQLSVLASRFPAGDITGLAAAGDGTLWIGSSKGEICHFDPVKVQCLDFFASADDSTQTMARGKLIALTLDTVENVYYATEGGGISRYNGKDWQLFTLPAEPLVGNQIQSLAQTKDGSIWAATEHGLQQLNPDTGATIQLFTQENSGIAVADTGVLYPDRTGGIWFGAQSASYFNGDNWSVYTAADGLANGLVQAIAVDSQQRVWFGTKSGLSVWNGSSFFTLNKATGLPSDDVTALLADGEQMWIGTNGGGLFRFEKNQLQLFNATKLGLPSNVITALAKAKDGALLVGTNRGLARVQDEVATLIAETADFSITVINATAEGSLWVGTADQGLWYFDGQAWSQPPTGGKPPAAYITTILVDPQRSVWIGGKSGGIIRYMP